MFKVNTVTYILALTFFFITAPTPIMDDRVLADENFSVHLDIGPTHISKTENMFKDHTGGFYGYTSAQDFIYKD